MSLRGLQLGLLGGANGRQGGEPPTITNAMISPAALERGDVAEALAEIGGWPQPATTWLWRLDGAPIGADRSVVVPAAGALSCVVTATNASGTASVELGPITVAEPAAAPVFTTAPSISTPIARVGETLTLEEGVATGSPAPMLTGRLTLNGVDVTSRMRGLTFTPDVAGELVWTVRAENAAGAVEAGATAFVEARASTNAYNYGLLTPAGQGGIALPSGATAITGGNEAGHFTVAGGRLIITATGASSRLSGSPYRITLDSGETFEITAVANMRSFSPADGELGARINTDLSNARTGSGGWSNAEAAYLELRPGDYAEANDTESIRRAGRLFPFIVRGDDRHPRPNITGQNFDIDNTDFLQFDWLRASAWSGSWFITSSANANAYNNAAVTRLELIGVPGIDVTTYRGGQIGKNGIAIKGLNTRIEGNYIEGVNRGVVTSYIGTLNINGNVVRGFSEDTIQVQPVGAVSVQSGGSISRNYFFGAVTSPSSGAHPDFIQFLSAVRGLKVNQNIGVHGPGQGPDTQCIFSNGSFSNGEIVGNVFVTKATIHGVSFQGASNAAILHNSLMSTSGSRPSINMFFNSSAATDDVFVAGNVTDSVVTTSGTGAATYLDARNNSANVTPADVFEGPFTPTTYAEALAAITSKGALLGTSPHDRGAVTGALSFGDDPLSETGYDLPAAELVYTPRAFRTDQWSVLNDGSGASLAVAGWINLPYQQLADIEYRVNGGSWVSSGLMGNGAVAISADLGDSVEVRGVNAAGDGAVGAANRVIAPVQGDAFRVTADASVMLATTLEGLLASAGERVFVAITIGSTFQASATGTWTLNGQTMTQVYRAPNVTGNNVIVILGVILSSDVANPVLQATASGAPYFKGTVGWWHVPTAVSLTAVDTDATTALSPSANTLTVDTQVGDVVLIASLWFGASGASTEMLLSGALADAKKVDDLLLGSGSGIASLSWVQRVATAQTGATITLAADGANDHAQRPSVAVVLRP